MKLSVVFGVDLNAAFDKMYYFYQSLDVTLCFQLDLFGFVYCLSFVSVFDRCFDLVSFLCLGHLYDSRGLHVATENARVLVVLECHDFLR